MSYDPMNDFNEAHQDMVISVNEGAACAGKRNKIFQENTGAVERRRKPAVTHASLDGPTVVWTRLQDGGFLGMIIK